jgi:hypothetical protein
LGRLCSGVASEIIAVQAMANLLLQAAHVRLRMKRR